MDNNSAKAGSTAVGLVLSIIILIIDVYIFRHVQTIKRDDYQCKCGKTWQVNKISDMIIAIISISLVNLIIQLFLSSYPGNRMIISLMTLVSFVSFGIQIYYIYLMISYLNDLKKTNCKCVDTTLVDTMFYYSYGKIALMSIALIAFIVLIFMIKNATQPIPIKSFASKSSRSRV